MKRLLLVLLLLPLVALQVRAQTQSANQVQTFTAVTSSGALGLAGSNTHFHTLQWWGFGTLTTCTIKVEQSATGTGGWTDLITAQTCTSNGSATIPGTPNFVRMTMTALTGGGTLTARYSGYISAPVIISAAAGYTTIEDEGIAQTQRTNANFVGAGVTVTDNGTKTVITIPGGGGAPVDAQYVTGASNATLTAEKILTDGTGIDTVLAGVDGGSATINFDFADKGASPALNSDECVFSNEGAGAGGLVCEGATADTFETRAIITDPTADRTFTIPNADSVAVQPDAGAANNFLTAISTLGVISKAQPSFANLSGTAADGQVDGSLEADELILAGDVDGAANANDLDEAAVEAELEGVIDLPDLQGILTAVKGGTGDDTSAVTGIPEIVAGNWTYTAGLDDLSDVVLTSVAGGDVLCFDGGVDMRWENCLPSGYDRIQDEGTNLTQTTTLNITGTGVTCVHSASPLRTDCDIPGAAVKWSDITAPTGATTFVSNTVGETIDFDFQAAFTTGTQFHIRQTTGNPTGGNLFGITVTDPDVLAFFINNATTNVITGNRAGTLAAITLQATGTTAGNLELLEGTAVTLVANSFQIVAPTDVAAGGLQFILPAAAGDGCVQAANAAGKMTLNVSACPGGGSGDAIEIEDGDNAGTFTAIDTTARFDDSGDINFTFADGGAGGPDVVTATVRADSVAIPGDTTGNYVLSVATGLGLAGGAAASEGATLTLLPSYSETLAGNPTLNIGEVVSSDDCTGGGFLSEGTTANTNEMLYCLPALDEADTTHTLATLTATQTLTGKTLTAADNAIEADDLICTNCIGPTEITDLTLTTDTAGNYVASVANGNGITGGAAGSEGAVLTLAIDLNATLDGVGATSNLSGMEFTATAEVALLQGCANNQILKWVDAGGTWDCAADADTGGAPTWNAITNPAGNLALTMGSNTSTFSTTTAVADLFKWANTTAATASVSQSSPFLSLAGTYWTGAVSAEDEWTVQASVANGTNGASTLAFTHTGSTGAATLSAPSFTATASGAGYIEFLEGAAPGLVANSFQIYPPADVAAGGLGFILPGTAASGFVQSTNAAGVMTISIAAIADADVPNTITIDLATTATTANAGDSATAFFAAGTLEDARLSTNVALYNNGSQTWGAGAGLNWTFNAGATDPVFEFTSGNVKMSGATTYTFEGGATDPVWTPGNSIMNLSTGTLQQGGANVTLTIANGTSALGTSSIASGACATVVTTAATGTATTDNIMADFNADPTAVTGYAPSANGMLTIIKYPTTNNVNYKVCNNTAAAITPGAITLNWRVVR